MGTWAVTMKFRNRSLKVSEPHLNGWQSGLTLKKINKGEVLVPAKLTSESARKFADLHLILGDIHFAINCLKEAKKSGIPNDSDLQSKALIFSGIVTYGRCFKTGVRSIDLNALIQRDTFDKHIHKYLIALRDKHITHSVNDFEDCEAVATMIGTPKSGWRYGSGIGVVKKQTIGISKELLQKAIGHIKMIEKHIKDQISELRKLIDTEFQEHLASGGKWEFSPILKISNRTNISKRRK